MVRPISTSLERILPRLAPLLSALHHGLAARVDDADLADTVSVRRLQGTTTEDWERMAAWFVARSGRVSRLDQLTRQAVAAVRTLTANVTRLSRIGLGAVSRRADFVRLAGFFDQAAAIREAHEIAAGAFGLGSCRRPRNAGLRRGRPGTHRHALARCSSGRRPHAAANSRQHRSAGASDADSRPGARAAICCAAIASWTGSHARRPPPSSWRAPGRMAG